MAAEMPPCDCCREIAPGLWRPCCDCRNYDDHHRANSWCEDKTAEAGAKGRAFGPFEVLPEGKTIVIGQAGKPHNDIAEVFYRDEHTASTSRVEALAIAALFAAAPELLAALKALVKTCDPGGGVGLFAPTYDDLEAARAAIAKAKVTP